MAARAVIGQIPIITDYIAKLRASGSGKYNEGNFPSMARNLSVRIYRIKEDWYTHPYKELLSLIGNVPEYPPIKTETYRSILERIRTMDLPTEEQSIKMAQAFFLKESGAGAGAGAPSGAAGAPSGAAGAPSGAAGAPSEAAAAPATLLTGVSANSPGTVSVLESTMHDRQVHVGKLCSYSSSGGVTYDPITDPHQQSVLVKAGQLISTIFEFEKILQPIPAVAAGGASAAAAGPNPTTHPLDYIHACFCNPSTSLEAGVPVTESYAVVDLEQYGKFAHKIIGACILSRTPTHWAIWSVVGDPYRVKAHTFHHMFNAIKVKIGEVKGPYVVKLIASDAPVPFVTFSDRLTLYATEGFEIAAPYPSLSGVAPDGQWAPVIPIEYGSVCNCFNISEPGGRLIMSYNNSKGLPLKALTVPASMPLAVQPLVPFFSWGHSNYSRAPIEGGASAMVPVSTGNVRVIVTTVPSSAVFGVYALGLINMLAEVLKYIPFSMLLKIFPGIRVSNTKPLVIAKDGNITQEFSNELYGGILIKLPTVKADGKEYGPLGLVVSNIFSIYVYDVNTYIPDMNIGYQDVDPARQAGFGLYKIDSSKPYVQDNFKTNMKLFGRSDRVAGELGTPGSVTTLGNLLKALQSPGEPRVLFHGLCGSIDGDASIREAATAAVTQRLTELHPKAVTLKTDDEFVSFIFKLGGAITNLAQQVSTVASRKNIAKLITSIVPAGGAGASSAKGGRRTQRKRRQ